MKKLFNLLQVLFAWGKPVGCQHSHLYPGGFVNFERKTRQTRCKGCGETVTTEFDTGLFV